MNRIGITLIVSNFLYSTLTFAGTIGENNPDPNWQGFYLGGNAGYLWSQNSGVAITTTQNYVNPDYLLGSTSLANALAQVVTNNFPISSDGFIGGGQIGYNYTYLEKIVIGFDTDIDALTYSKNRLISEKSAGLVGFNEAYIGSAIIKQNIDFLGTARARIGYLYKPSILLFGVGGFAYGGATIDTYWTASESLGSEIYPTITTKNNKNRVLSGWTAGAGIEWLFQPSWSAKFEYTYYALNKFNVPTSLIQVSESQTPAATWASITANTALSVLTGSFRLGINYHF
ncbi:MAG: outer membrane beta-barrel protein [Legionellaceae bacterium]|nr:outer membrane beta-barrel protein [Legionellaceae bacterium]